MNEYIGLLGVRGRVARPSSWVQVLVTPGLIGQISSASLQSSSLQTVFHQYRCKANEISIQACEGVYDTCSAPVRSRSCCLRFSNTLTIFSNKVGEATAFLICCCRIDGIYFNSGADDMRIERPTSIRDWYVYCMVLMGTGSATGAGSVALCSAASTTGSSQLRSNWPYSS